MRKVINFLVLRVIFVNFLIFAKLSETDKRYKNIRYTVYNDHSRAQKQWPLLRSDRYSEVIYVKKGQIGI
jgi:hypothetical protein